MFRPVKDYNEIANHFIECAHAHCCNTRLQVFSITIASHAIHASDIFLPFALCIEIWFSLSVLVTKRRTMVLLLL